MRPRVLMTLVSKPRRDRESRPSLSTRIILVFVVVLQSFQGGKFSLDVAGMFDISSLCSERGGFPGFLLGS